MSDDKSRARLGRGLASLIGGGAGTARPGGSSAFALPGGPAGPVGERRVPPSQLAPNPENPRRTFDEAALEELAASIRVHGVVQPILVRRRGGEGAPFEIVAGERRWRASQIAGVADVPIVVRDLTDRETLAIAIIENVQRADLNAVEEAMGYEALIREHGYTQNDLAEIVGKSRSHVANTLRLLKLPEGVKDMVRAGELSAGAARTAVSAADPEAFARRIVEGGMSVREAEEAARVAAEPQDTAPTNKPATARKAKEKDAKDPDTLALESLLSESLSMPVSIELAGSGGKGRLSLDFADLDQLDELCRLLRARSGRAASEPKVRSL